MSSKTVISMKQRISVHCSHRLKVYKFQMKNRYRIPNLTGFFVSSAYFINGNTQLMSNLKGCQFYPSAKLIWLYIPIYNADKYCKIYLKIMLQNWVRILERENTDNSACKHTKLSNLGSETRQVYIAKQNFGADFLQFSSKMSKECPFRYWALFNAFLFTKLKRGI